MAAAPCGGANHRVRQMLAALDRPPAAKPTAAEQIRELEAKKRAAVEGQRYEEAAALKAAIAGVRAAVRCQQCQRGVSSCSP